MKKYNTVNVSETTFKYLRQYKKSLHYISLNEVIMELITRDRENRNITG
jgi:hypothetical protein